LPLDQQELLAQLTLDQLVTLDQRAQQELPVIQAQHQL
jgi:hypothetical protein